ncbi:hypothetical protein GCM10010521_38370 [Streptomyces rameus]|uniref:Uncharacterized protein n=1 Tax=Streptomyces rameus TaxID=68261 RepID=A0ABP6NGH5_9ACTN
MAPVTAARARRHPAQQPAGAPGQPRPGQQQGQGQHAHRHRRRVQAGQLRGKIAQIGEDGTVRAAAEDDVQLGDGDGDADAGEHAVHHGRTDRERAARHP